MMTGNGETDVVIVPDRGDRCVAMNERPDDGIPRKCLGSGVRCECVPALAYHEPRKLDARLDAIGRRFAVLDLA